MKPGAIDVPPMTTIFSARVFRVSIGHYNIYNGKTLKTKKNGKQDKHEILPLIVSLVMQ